MSNPVTGIHNATTLIHDDIGGSSLSGMTVEWRLEVKTERTERATKDDFKIPATGTIPVSIDQPWKIYEGCTASHDFFGGKITLWGILPAFPPRQAGKPIFRLGFRHFPHSTLVILMWRRSFLKCSLHSGNLVQT
jgi:hypothetical protein